MPIDECGAQRHPLYAETLCTFPRRKPTWSLNVLEMSKVWTRLAGICALCGGTWFMCRTQPLNADSSIF